jgi:hypothetical protein
MVGASAWGLPVPGAGFVGSGAAMARFEEAKWFSLPVRSGRG